MTTAISTCEGSNWTQDATRCLEKLNRKTFVDLVPVIVFISLLFVVEVLGNLLVLLVYLKQFQPSATRVFVLALAACDLLTNVLMMPCVAARARLSYAVPGPNYCGVGLVAMFPILTSYWILDCVATYLLLVPFTLTSVLILPYGVLETGVHGFNGTTCGFVPSDAGVISFVAVMTFGVLGFCLATFAYTHILVQICRIQRAKLSSARANVDTRSPGRSKQAEVKVTNFETPASQDTRTKDVTIAEVRSVNGGSTGLERPTETCRQRQQDHDGQRGADNSHSRLADKNQGREDQKAKGEAQHGQLKRMVFSKTTLMMLVLTFTTAVLTSPQLAISAAKLDFVGVNLTSWEMNLRFLTLVLPTVNSVINPFIYFFCNPNFRLQCRLFLVKVRSRVRT